MNTNNDPRDKNPDQTRSSGVASAKHRGLHRPDDDQRVEQALDDVGLEDRGDVVEDQWRDRRSRGGAPDQEPTEERKRGQGGAGSDSADTG